MRIVLAQTHIAWEDRDKNLAKATRIIENNDADLILFPEMSFTGFSMNTDLTAEEDRYSLEQMKALARTNHKAVGFGWVRRSKDCLDKCENVYSVVDENGELLSDYTKIHPFSYSGEDKYFVGGRSLSFFHVKEVPFTSFICYDLRFPELFRAAADRVHAIIVSACWPEKRAEQWKALLRARAIENQVYIFAVNCVGDIGGLVYSGDSCVIDPDGKIREMLSDREGTIEFNLEDDVEDYRTFFSVLRDRRKAIYGLFEY